MKKKFVYSFHYALPKAEIKVFHYDNFNRMCRKIPCFIDRYFTNNYFILCIKISNEIDGENYDVYISNDWAAIMDHIWNRKSSEDEYIKINQVCIYETETVHDAYSLGSEIASK